MKRLALLIVALGAFTSTQAFAGCSSPTGIEGEIIYNDDYDIVQFCDDTNWVKMGASADSRIGTLTNTKWCASDGAAINCTQDAPVLAESDPKIGTLTNTKWCSTNGTVINCTEDAPAAGVAGSDKQIQFNDGGSTLAAAAQLYWDKANNRLGIGTATPGTIIEAHHATDPAIRMYDTDQTVDARLSAAGSASRGQVGTVSNHPFALFTNNTVRLNVAANGNITHTPAGGNSTQGFYINMANLGTSSNALFFSRPDAWTGNFISANDTAGVQQFSIGADGGAYFKGNVAAATFSGSGASLTALNASNLSSGTVGSARLGSGTADNTTYLRGDGTWAAPSVSETDPQVGTLTANRVCVANAGGTAADCATTTTGTGSVAMAASPTFTGTVGAAAITASGTVTANLFSGSGASLTSLDASNLANGTVGTARLGSGTANNTTYLRGDGTWAAEADPKVGALTNTKWCSTNGTIISCTQDAPSGGAPGGSNGQVQYNNNGAFAGDSMFTFDPNTSGLGLTISGYSSYAITGTTNNSNGTGVYGNALGGGFNVGVYGNVQNTGYGVLGRVAGTSGSSVGGYFYSLSSSGIGVLAESGHATGIGLVVKGRSGQTANLVQFQDSGGTVLSRIDSVGNVSAPASGYYNFGSTTGSSGYGIRDNGGTVEIKNSGGSWASPGGPGGGKYKCGVYQTGVTLRCVRLSDGLRCNEGSGTWSCSARTNWPGDGEYECDVNQSNGMLRCVRLSDGLRCAEGSGTWSCSAYTNWPG